MNLNRFRPGKKENRPNEIEAECCGHRRSKRNARFRTLRTESNGQVSNKH
jgi:hypothetical protein